jgi:phage/plasmid primase-like uncharacterized protein
MNDPLSTLALTMKAAGLPASQQPFRITSKIERFTPAGDHQENGWYVLYNLQHAVVGAYGCWKRGLKEKFCSADKNALTPQQWGEISKAWKDAEQARKEEEERLKLEAREKCKALFTLPTVTDHPYLKKKQVMAHGKVVLSNQTLTPNWMALPLADEKGTIHSAQFIADDGAKRFMFGGRVQGCWFTLADTSDGPLCITEGYATGASVHQATGWATVCAMNAGNLPAVAAAIRKLHPDRTLIIAADNDQFTDGNPGLTKARAAAKPVSATVIYPEFADESLGEKPTDFNDLQRISGSGEVKRQIIEGARMGGDWDLLIQDACDTMTEVIPEPTELVEGLLCEQAKLVIGGSSKTYKTWITMDMALSLSAGGMFIGRRCRRSRVLYVNFELKESTFKRRIQTIAKAKGIHFDYQQFFHISLRGKISRLTPQQIVDRIVKMALKRRCTVVVVDPIYKLNTKGKDENAAGEQTVFLNELDRITTEGQCSLIFDDHFSKGSQSDKDPLDAIRGSSAKGGDVDAAIIIRKHDTEGSFSVDVVHRELAPVAPFVITWQFPLFHPNENLDAADMKQPKRTGRPSTLDAISILEALEKTSEFDGLTISDLMERLKAKRTTLQRHLETLRLKSLIATAGEGNRASCYITEKGQNYLAHG